MASNYEIFLKMKSARITELEQQLAEARKDTERLNLIKGLSGVEVLRAITLLNQEKRHAFDADYAIWRDANGPGR